MSKTNNPVTPKGRVHFAKVFAPEAFTPEQTPKYSLMLSFPNEAMIQEIVDNVDRAIADKWGTAVPRGLKLPYVYGSEVDWNGFESGTIGIRFSSKFKPTLVDQDLVEFDDFTDPGKFYDGCYARVSYSTYAYDNVSKGVMLNLHHIQKLDDGEQISNRSSAAEDFAPMK